MLLAGTDGKRRNAYTLTHKKCADTFGGTELVASDREQIDAKLLHIYADLTNRLCSIRMN